MMKRQGFTLVELMLVVAIGALMGYAYIETGTPDPRPILIKFGVPL